MIDDKLEYVGSKIFDKIVTDERVTKDLEYCIYCSVSSSGKDRGIRNINYRITLDCILGSDIKQCPACKRIYILKDPTE